MMEPAPQGISRWRTAGGTLAGSLLGGTIGIIAGFAYAPVEAEPASGGPFLEFLIESTFSSIFWLLEVVVVVAAGGLLGAIAGAVAGSVLGTRRSAVQGSPETKIQGRKASWFLFGLSLVMLTAGILGSGMTVSHCVLWLLLGGLAAWNLFGQRSRTT